jgi:hypothetical protein
VIIRTKVQTKIYPDELNRKVHRAEHAVAVQAERDSRPYIPAASGRLRSSGRVYGSTIVWDRPYARRQYFGKVYVDPRRKIGGFPTPDGWRSFRGVKKVRSQRDYHHASGGPQWFSKAKNARVAQWIALAQGVIARE